MFEHVMAMNSLNWVSSVSSSPSAMAVRKKSARLSKIPLLACLYNLIHPVKENFFPLRGAASLLLAYSSGLSIDSLMW